MDAQGAIARLLNLGSTDRRRLADALFSGRLSPPYGSLATRAILGGQAGDQVVEALTTLGAEGMLPRHVALWLAAATVPQARPVLLVTSGPETQGATARDTGAVVRELFGAARESVLIVGYAVHQGRDVFRVLAQRMDEVPDLRVRLCLDVTRPYGDTSHASEILGRFAFHFRTEEWPGRCLPEVLYDPRALETDATHRASLHAKCVVVDQARALVSSANFTEAAQVRNIEVGVLIEVQDLAATIAKHFDGLAAAGHLVPVPGLGQPPTR